MHKSRRRSLFIPAFSFRLTRPCPSEGIGGKQVKDGVFGLDGGRLTAESTFTHYHIKRKKYWVCILAQGLYCFWSPVKNAWIITVIYRWFPLYESLMLNSVSSAKGYYFSAAKNDIHGPIPQRGKTWESNLQSCNCVVANTHPQLHKMKNQKQNDKKKNFCDETDGDLFIMMHWPLRSFMEIHVSCF